MLNTQQTVCSVGTLEAALDLVQLARQGDTQAIATLLKRAFEKQNIIIKVNRKDQCLQILLEAAQVPEQTAAMYVIQQMMSVLQPARLSMIRVYSRRSGAAHYVWQQEFPVTYIEPVPAISSQESSAEELARAVQHDSPQRQLARKGDPDAIAAWLNDLLAGQQITAQVSWQDYRLHIILTARTVPPQTPILRWLDCELTNLDAFMIQNLVVQGRAEDSGTPAWQAEFEIGAYVQSSVESSPSLESSNSVSNSATDPVTLADSSNLSTSVQPDKAISQPIRLSPTRRTAPTPPSPKLRSQAITTQGWSALLTGFVLAILLFALAPLKLLFRGFLVMVHEVGHAITHWLFGRPAIPMIDFAFGGGLTLHFEQSWVILALIYGAIAFLMFLCRVYPRLQGIVALCTLVYSICLFTNWNLILSTFMGHGMELVAIFGCLYLAISGYFCRMAGDRAIYAMLGFFTFFCDLQFGWQLLYDTDFQAWYGEGKGGIIDNDLVILASDYFGVDLAAVVYVFLAICIMTPVLAFLLFRYEPWLRTGFRKLLVAS